MIYVGGVQFLDESSSFSLSSSSQGSSLLVDVMSHPVITLASDSFKNLEEKNVSFDESDSESSTKDRYVYIFQREFAVVNPALVDFVGTDEATTCVGLVIRNRKSGMTSVAHMDSPEIVDLGISQMLLLVLQDDVDAELDVHMVGGYEDVDIKNADGVGDYAKPEGYSFPLCCKLVETLQKRRENFHIQTLFILGHNTKLDSQANTCPIFNGCLVNTSTGAILPASFNRTSRCPDEIVRRIRVSSSFEDSSWKGKLLDTYDTKTDRFIIAPCRWTMRLIEYVWELNQLTDEEILTNCSTSPSAEGPDFVNSLRRLVILEASTGSLSRTQTGHRKICILFLFVCFRNWGYLLKYPEWSKTFPRRQPRVFERTVDGHWKKC
ncbi:Protein N-terminal asparagine amidohydrolase [Arabidopsis thaliana x Arabidopsis arenosa]|jgi:protein N-terminal asparagine amidohydrolase|uniref:Protein N-terminal asparagine amidohydrolase family protein n=3 Tax=Arabidopsis TaxID=3701 RepID=A0A1P8AZF7_ARATH|nr:protein N-terminal asparagine amidohydrolase family protein [Arabidopsis thaliana]ANM62040.1 protein N-terminal asparagine amidohydrolase family protein [Arabidopsis thaliana]KAG7639690.1 Protein N-terminal asparagine amidohydrolase [Arabidopsis thaliana x Arabidopsis arenosa]KAG7644274.1 Protein N-terminal asparagine amidohydrolase [Arabidopsis suecica]|eukprot:NP_001324222.1 protein N-terminal asparagine amidohydrolase family protein [Arabidopsis thaliana]